MKTLARCTLALVLACGTRSEEAQPQRPPEGEVWLGKQQVESQQLKVDAAREQTVASSLDAAGRITFDDLQVAHVFSPASGRVVKILAQPGQRVKKGAPLVELESPEMGAAFADLGKAEADLAAAERELKRQRALVQAEAGAQRDLDQAESAHDRARAELGRARQRAELFRSRASGVSQRFVLRSPIDGEVIARAANPGSEVQGQYSGTSPELFTIGSISRVWAVADVFEVDLPRIKPGAEVQVRVVSAPGRTFKGRVEWIAASLDPVSRTARVRCTLANPGRELLPEMYATLEIATPARQVLAVPRSAIVHVGEERVVFVQSGTTETGQVRFQRRRVVLDDGDGELVPIRSGLAAGDLVVTSGALLLSGML